MAEKKPVCNYAGLLKELQSGDTLPSAGGGLSVAIICNQQAVSTAGGTLTAGSDQTRTLNTVLEDADSIIVSLTSNRFTLAAGTYEITWHTENYNCLHHRSWLYDQTNAAVIERGSNGYATANAQSYSVGFARVAITANTAYEIRDRVGQTETTTGQGLATHLAGNEIYTPVKIVKIA